MRLPARDEDLSTNGSRSQSRPCPRFASGHSAFDGSHGSATAGVVTDFAVQHMESHRAAFRISDGVQFPVKDACRPTDPSTPSTLFCTRAASRALCLHIGRIDHDRVRISPPRQI